MESDTSDTESAFSSQSHGRNPPLDEWAYFNVSTTRRRRLGGLAIELEDNLLLYITGIFTEWPTISPTAAPIVRTTQSPTTLSPTTEPIFTTLSPSAAPSNAPTSYPTVECAELTVITPTDFHDEVAADILSNALLYQGVISSSPYWSLECDHIVEAYTAGCASGYSGTIYLSGNGNGDTARWVMSIHSESADYYKAYSTETADNAYFVPMVATWTDMETEETWQFVMECDAMSSPEGTSAARGVTDNNQEERTWAMITIVCIILLIIAIVIAAVVYVRHKRAKPVKKQMEMNLHEPAVQLQGGEEDFVSGVAYLPYNTPKSHYTVPTRTQSGIQMKTPSADDVNEPIDFPVEPNADGDGNATTTGGLDDLDWDDEDQIFAV